MKRVLGLLIALMVLGVPMSSAKTKSGKREYPVSGVVYKKSRGVEAKHVTEESGESAKMTFNYFVCIQRDPASDLYADDWLVYRQCWDTTKEVWEAVNVCDWFMVKEPQIHDQDTRPDSPAFQKQRRDQARAIKKSRLCKQQ